MCNLLCNIVKVLLENIFRWKQKEMKEKKKGMHDSRLRNFLFM